MAYFSKNYKVYPLPDNCPSNSIDIHHASEFYPARSYDPPFPKPPSGQLDALGLKARIAYGNRLRQNRDITPRTMRFINWWKERCTAMLNANPFARKKMVKEVEILDDEIQSRYDKIHGPDGLCTALIEVFNAIAELRMMAEYGDYLAYTCLALKGDNMSDVIWKIKKLDWQAVTAEIKQEESRLAEEKARRLAPSPTPFLDDIARAANKLGYETSMVRYQILAYGERNNFCHTGIKAMIHHADFQQLGERIVEDKRSLDVIFRGRPYDQIEMRRLIKVVEKEWFYHLYIDETRKGRPVKFIPSEKALQRMRSLLPSRPPSPF